MTPPDTFATFTTFLAILCLHVGLSHTHLRIRFEDPAFFVSGAINLVTAAGIFSERHAEVLRYSPLARTRGILAKPDGLAKSLYDGNGEQTSGLHAVDDPFMDLK